MVETDIIRYTVYVFAAITGLIMAEAAYMLLGKHVSGRRAINRRMLLQDGAATQKDVLLQLRKERGLDGQNRSSLLGFLARLRLQSAMKMRLPLFLLITTSISFAISLFAWKETGMDLVAASLALFLMVIIPIQFLRMKRKRRLNKFGRQLPEALELITRGLRAGHPVPIAISMVSREMQDPIGTEFGILSDEVTYGADLVTALKGLFDRVGHEDLALFVTAVSIQSSTGGNLRETLDGLADVIRQRGKLRRKIRSISAEGRMTAYILSAIPVLVVGALSIFAPNYYGAVIDEAYTWQLLAGAFTWLLIGNAVMFKMASFKF